MSFLSSTWALLTHRNRKRKLLKALRLKVHSTILDESTYFVYLDVTGIYGKDYALAQLKKATYDMILKEYVRCNVGRVFYTDLLPMLIDDWFKRLTNLGSYTYSAGTDKHTFAVAQPPKAARIFLLVGDTALNRLDKKPVARHDLSDMMFDILERKAHENVATQIYSDGMCFVNLLTLKSNGLTPSYDEHNNVQH